jgi:hypothetical protein
VGGGGASTAGWNWPGSIVELCIFDISRLTRPALQKAHAAGLFSRSVTLPEHIDEIVATCQHRTEATRYSRRVTMEEVERNDFNLNISRCVTTKGDEEEIELQAVHADLQAIEQQIAEAKARHNGFLAELGLPLLP